MPPNHENTKIHKKEFKPLPEELEIIGKKIVDAASLLSNINGVRIKN